MGEKQICGEAIMRGELEMVTWKNDALGKEVEGVRKLNDDLGKEVSRKRKEIKEEKHRRRGWRDKYEAKRNEAEILKRKSKDLSCDLERLSEAIERERRDSKEEAAAMMMRVRTLEAAEDELLQMATKSGFVEVEDEIYNDDALESVSKEMDDAQNDEASVDEIALLDLPNLGTSEVELETGRLVSTKSSDNRTVKRRRLAESISSVDSEVMGSLGENLLPRVYQDGATHGKEAKEDHFDFSLLDSSHEDASGQM